VTVGSKPGSRPRPSLPLSRRPALSPPSMSTVGGDRYRRREHEHEPSSTSSVPSRKWELAAAGNDGFKLVDRSTAAKPEADLAKPTCVRSPSPLPANTAADDVLNATSGSTLSTEIFPGVSPAVVPVETTPAMIVDSPTPSSAPISPHTPVAAATAETTYLVMAPMGQGSSNEAPAPACTLTAALAEMIETMDQMMVDGSPSPASTVMHTSARAPAAHAPTSSNLLAVPAVRTLPTPAPPNSTLALIGAPPARRPTRAPTAVRSSRCISRRPTGRHSPDLCKPSRAGRVAQRPEPAGGSRPFPPPRTSAGRARPGQHRHHPARRRRERSYSSRCLSAAQRLQSASHPARKGRRVVDRGACPAPVGCAQRAVVCGQRPQARPRARNAFAIFFSCRH
jgi:hypothetical protein